MNVFASLTSATRAALLYITVGSVTIVWSGISYVYLENHPPADGSDSPWYWCSGFLLTGCALLIIGLAVGWIGRSARQAEQPHALLNTRDSQGNPTSTVVPLANSAVIPPNNAAPVNGPASSALVQPLVLPRDSTRS
jgi:hypothetical protein